MIALRETGSPNVVGVKLTGKLHDEDYQQFVPQMETILTAQGKVRVFIELEDFHGWDLQAAWDDFKFGLKHYSDFERIALVGDRKWGKRMAGFWKPFTKAKVRYFDPSEIDAAWAWLRDAEEDADKGAGDQESDEAIESKMWNAYHWYGL